MRNAHVVIVVFAWVLGSLGCFQRSPDKSRVTCSPGISDVCYTGPASTDGVGVCHFGQSMCWEADGVIQQQCLNERVPSAESCNGLDDDCDGSIDEDGVCSSEKLASFEQTLGMKLHPVFHPGRMGPAYLIRPEGGSMWNCAPDQTTAACALDFLKVGGDIWGIDDPEHGLAQDGGDRVTDSHVVFTQLRNGIPVEGRWIGFSRSFPPDSRGNALVSVRGRLARIPSTVSQEAAVSATEAITKLPIGSVQAGEPVLVLHEEPGTARSPDGPAFRLAWRIAHLDASGIAYRTWIDAESAAVLLTVKAYEDDTRRRLTDGGTGSTWVEPPAIATPPNPGNARDAWNTMANWITFLLQSGVVDDNDGGSDANLDSAAHLRVTLDDTTGCCATSSCGGYNDGTQDHICPGNYDDECLAHELGHFLVDRYWSGNGYVCDQEHDALVETFSQVFAEFWQCSSGACTFVHRGGRDFSHPRTLDDLAAAGQACPDGGYPSRYDDAMIPGSALQQFYASLVDRGLSGDVAVRVVMAVSLTALPALGTTSGNGVNPNTLEFFDYFTSLDDACKALSGSATIVGTGGSTHVMSPTDCNDLKAAFARAGIVTTCEVPDPQELCNGIDDDCDGFTDECNSEADCCGPILGADPDAGCDWKEKAARGNPLIRYCYDGPSGTANVGDCRSGFQTCSGGRWSGTCANQILPKNEACDAPPAGQAPHDENCNGVANEESVKQAFVWDSDGDGVHGPYNPVLFCAGAQPSGYVPDSPIVDCDDRNASIHPPDIDEGTQGKCNGIDDDCDGIVDDGCPCNPLKDVPKACGPKSGGTHCDNGVVRCEWDAASKSYKWSTLCYGDNWGYSEVCDGVDNDCNGQVDDNPIDIDPLELCTSDTAVGRCATHGHFACQAGRRVCVPAKPIAEACNWEDRDCDSVPGVFESTACERSLDLPSVILDHLIHIRGDCDFDSSNVNMTLELNLSVAGNCLIANLHLFLEEANWDWTTGETWDTAMICTDAPILQLESPNHQVFQAQNSGCNDYHDYQPGGRLLSLHCMGDTEGEDVCGEPLGEGGGCEVFFNPVKVRVMY